MVNKQHLSIMKTNLGNTIADLSSRSPVLLVFLRHFGCVFCKDSMYDISKRKNLFEKEGIRIVMVHMADHNTAMSYFKKFNIQDLEHVSDPDCKFYQIFGLIKGSFSQLFGLKSWARGVEIAATRQMLPDVKRIGDGLQMPGIFLLKNGNIVESFIHNSVADKPNYDNFLEICQIN